MSSSSSAATGDYKPLPGFLGNLTELQEYRLKEAYLCIGQLTGQVPKTAKVGVPVPKTPEKVVHKSRFGFKSSTTAALPEANEVAHSLQELKKAVGDLKQEEVHEALLSATRLDHPDSLILRFLRARKWDTPKAMEQFGDTLRWRIKGWNIDTLLERGEEYYIDVKPDPGFINQYKEGKVTIHGHDKQGRPIVFIHVEKHDPKAQSEEAMERYTLNVIESARLCLSREVSTAAVVFDLSGFGLGNMDYHVVKFILTCFEHYYPECLGYLFIHKAPWVFSSVWAIIKGWIDPVVAAKISFTKNEKDLLKFIDSDQIPKSLGGTSPFEYKWIPPKEGESRYLQKTEERQQKLKERDALFAKFEEITQKWVAATDKEQSHKLNVERNQVADQIYDQYWHLDPYVRARSIGDRNGSLGEFKPELRPGGVAQPTL